MTHNEPAALVDGFVPPPVGEQGDGELNPGPPPVDVPPVEDPEGGTDG